MEALSCATANYMKSTKAAEKTDVLSLKSCRQIRLPSSALAKPPPGHGYEMVRKLGFVHEVEAPAPAAAVHFIGLHSRQALGD